MNKQEKKQIISRIAADIWNRGEIDLANDFMTSDAQYYGPHMPDGVGRREDWKNAIKMYRIAFPDSHVTYDELMETKDTVIGRWHATGTNTGALPGLSPTGKPIAISGITIYRFTGTKISEAWEQLDMLGMWQQLGVIKLPERH